MSNVSPAAVISEIAYAIPPECREHVIVVGSLAAGFHFFGKDTELYVRTKDVDSVLCPRSEAVRSGKAVAERLIALGWRQKAGGEFGNAGTASTPDDRLPAVRLHPPGSEEWFVEFLTLADDARPAGRHFLRLELSTGHYGLPSFEFLSLSTFEPVRTPYGVHHARVEMMALANLLEHPEIKPDMIRNTFTKRSNKDLGRVLAIARLSSEAEILSWPNAWRAGLQACQPGRWRQLAGRAGAGIRRLLESRDDFLQAVEDCNNGLLSARKASPEELDATARRLLQDALEPLEADKKA
jgi:hypothetical protein